MSGDARGVSTQLDFTVIDETAEWIVVEKPAPLVVHPTGEKDEPTLLGGLQALLACELAGGGTLSILTRLDRETSGVVLVAKTRPVAHALSLQFEKREVRKKYLAMVHGWPEWEQTVCNRPILRAGEVQECPIWVRQRVHPQGKPCTTGFRVEDRFQRSEGRFSSIRCFPESGRMHQIRVHLEALGHPIVGDKVYGGGGEAYLEQVRGELSEESVARMILPRQALHCTELGVRWAGEWRVWKSPRPSEFARFSSGSPVGVWHG